MTDKVYIEQFIDKEAVFTHAEGHPAMHPKRKPTIETALKAVLASVEYIAQAAIIEKYKPIMADLLDVYEINNGPFEETTPDNRADWEAGLDDEIEKEVEPLTPILSASWLGEWTIGAGLHEEGGFDRWLNALGKEVFKQLAFGKEPGQVMASAGITRPDVDAWFSTIEAQIDQPAAKVETEQMDADMESVIAKIRKQIGEGFDPMAVLEDLTQLHDDDEGLSGSSASRLGLTQQDVEVVQFQGIEVGVDECAEQMMAALQSDAVAMPPKKAAAKPAAAAPAAPATPKAAMPEGFNGQFVINSLKAHSAIKDTDFAAALGVSRSTFVNWGTGKTAFAPTDEQKATLRNQLVSDLNGLYAALCMVDGVGVDKDFE